MALKFILAAFATYRLAQLVAFDAGPAYAFQKLRNYINFRYTTERGIWENIDEGINCPYCLGIYFAALCLVLVLKPTRLGDFLLWWGAIAGAQTFMQELTKGR